MPEPDPPRHAVEDDHADDGDADDGKAPCKPCKPNGEPFPADFRLEVKPGFAKDGEKKDLIYCPGGCGAGYPYPHGMVVHLTGKQGANCLGMKFGAPWTGGGDEKDIQAFAKKQTFVTNSVSTALRVLTNF